MNLIIDIGNTLCKLAVFDNDTMVGMQAYEHISKQDFDDFTAPYPIEKAIYASVSQTPDFIRDYCAENGLVFNHQTPIPITNKYQSPETLGLDRLALAVAANKLAPHTNAMVISAGTCITYDIINEKQEYIGGAISPGLRMRAKALNSFTERLPIVDIDKLDQLDFNTELTFGTDTLTSIQSGIMQGAFGEINSKINWFTDNYKKKSIFLTGGDHFYFVNSIKITIFAIPNMVLIGLNEILNYNKKHA